MYTIRRISLTPTLTFGAAPFPPGYAATVHFLWPSSTNQTWTLLGHISNEKPSAIFKLGGKRAIPQIKPMDSTMEDTEVISPFAAMPTVIAQLGISIEPIQNVLAQTATLPSGTQPLTPSAGSGSNMMAVSRSSTPGDFDMIASRLLEHLYNYCCSFSGSLPSGGMALFGMDWGSTFIPLQALQNWYTNVQKRIKTDPGFLK
ncbi:hypothetical protein BASA50_000406 [Batrachochytrium salamandrivorans]|uniref:Hikeshi-like domain-containing protein n=1 Tax=Batrachochytrium salamandrivorans TaxID=1357716 RepID=A0ABQ8ETR5_9FUNG|nr:hypothetical protein BASA60_008589 [Batrachochytrium salamandrivorans]KAH6576066.1 hypothetical protein BASA62_001612 [Batrachochytrium salamandrivorans]KAH6581973.1 hypothetical protein BASA61_008720 [Batrachochytrium salamandrivorans]KAH6586451.1 hypothetical protein BASA50_000406 [Batrachochytrium salamandrivorans]KAH9275483.1 hypothetical protein BASA83_002257 [Batrachochytrium salamandrivorans]